MENQKLENILNLALAVNEQEREKSAQLEVGYSKENRTWELIVKYNGDISRFASELIQIEELIAGYAIVTLPENMVEVFSELEEVEYVEKPKRLYFSTLQGKQVSCVFPVTARPPYLTGKGVLIGVIDSGIALESPEFWDNNGNTRIQYLWDQTLNASAVGGGAMPPEGFAIGVEFSGEIINRAYAENRLSRLVPSYDTSGHGTAVTAIAAAGGRLTNERYQGVAPESELIIVKLGSTTQDGFPKTTELMRALTYTVKKAIELGRPIAINLSFGNTYGSHDGTSLLERFVDNVAEMGRTVICVGSGNEGAAGGHLYGQIVSEQNIAAPQMRAELNVGEYQTAVSVQLWKEYVDRFRISLVSPSGLRRDIDTLSVGKQSFVLEETEILLYIGEPAPYSVNQEIYFDMIPVGNYINAGIWTFEIEALDTVSGNYDFYLPSSGVLSSDTRFFTPSAVKTLTIPSTAAKVITVGAYDAVYDAYADFSGRGYHFQSTLGEPNGQNGIKPDLAAPGVNIQTIGPGNTFVQVSGTSFATPFVTGSAALLMEWGIVRGNDPFLYGEKIKAYLRRGARKIRGESRYPNERVGYGALCVENSLPI